MKCQYELEQKQKKKKIPMADMKKEIMDELDEDPCAKESWILTMKLRRTEPKKGTRP